MFESFFPSPKRFLWSAVVWAGVCIAIWHLGVKTWEDPLGIAGVFGRAPGRGWLYEYTALSYGAFVAAWMRLTPHRWARWSVAGSALIVFTTWFQVQLDVMINEWFGTFYDSVQQAEPGTMW